MLKGECKYELKKFIEKEGVDYHGLDISQGMSVNQYSKDKELMYYSYSFLNTFSNKIGNYKQEYAYNHLAHIVDYRDNTGVKWSKQYTPEGYELIYKNHFIKYGFRFNYQKNKLIRIDSNGKKEIIDTSNCTTVSIINGIDFSDRFIIENDNLIKYFIEGLTHEEIVNKILAFKDINIQVAVTNYIDRNNKEN